MIVFGYKKQCFVYTRDSWDFSRNRWWRSPHHVRMVEHGVHLGQRGLDASSLFLNVNYHVQMQYSHIAPLSTNVTLGVFELSYSESILNTSHPSSAIVGLPLIHIKLKLAFLMTPLLSKHYRSGRTLLTIFTSTRLSTKLSKHATIYSKIFGKKADDFCLSKSMRFIQEVLARQVLNLGSDMNEPKQFVKAARRLFQRYSCMVEPSQKDG